MKTTRRNFFASLPFIGALFALKKEAPISGLKMMTFPDWRNERKIHTVNLSQWSNSYIWIGAETFAIKPE